MESATIQAISLLGFPAVALIAIGTCTWRACIWIAPMIREAFAAHVGLVEAMKINAPRQTSLMESINETTGTLSHQNERLTAALEQHGTVLESISARLDGRPNQ